MNQETRLEAADYLIAIAALQRRIDVWWRSDRAAARRELGALIDRVETDFDGDNSRQSSLDVARSLLTLGQASEALERLADVVLEVIEVQHAARRRM